MRIYSPRQKKKTGLTGFFVLLIVVLSVFFGVKTAFSLLRNLPKPERINERTIAESTKIYDRTGEILLYEIYGEEKRTVIPISEIPPQVKYAAIAAEDINFYRHKGLDWKGIIRAAFKNIIRGDIVQGGSTITQQLIKNSLLGSEKTFSRKIKELILAVLLERKYSKDEILELYLNQIPYGQNAYGIAAASQTYFNKKPSELTLAEAALLASLPKAPSYYSPYGPRKDELLLRKNWVLERMNEAGFAEKNEAFSAQKETLKFSPPQKSMRAPHFVFFVRDYLNQKYGEKFVEKNGMKIITTLDAKLQEEAERIIKTGAEENEKLVKAYNASLVAIDPRSGEILAMVGSRDYWSEPKPKNCKSGSDCKFDPYVNVALRPRQPGSAFKPFVYAAAFQKGFTPETVLFDASTEFNPLCLQDGTPGPLVKDVKECYHPQNYDGLFRGPVSLRQALAQSLNIPSVKLLYLAGVNDSIETAKNLGITTLTKPERYGLSLVLGGAEVTLLEMVSAFGAFSQEGILHPYRAIARIKNANGEIIEENKTEFRPALDTEIARLMNDVLSDNDARVPVFNPQSSLYFAGRQVAAKTGTTEDYRDAWVIGYTPSLVAGVWVGNNDNSPLEKSGLSVMIAGPLWHRFMEFALSSSPPEEFAKANITIPEKPVLRGLYRSGETIKIDKISKKLAASYTPPELVEEISTGPVKSILALVNKNDLSGNQPAEPPIDPQFKNWQAGIEYWLSQNKISEPQAPKEYDDIHIPQKQPKINIIHPKKEEAASNFNEIKTEINAYFPLQEVFLFLNDELVDSRTFPILSKTITFKLKNALEPGNYRIKITAYDAVGNKTSAEQEQTIGQPQFNLND